MYSRSGAPTVPGLVCVGQDAEAWYYGYPAMAGLGLFGWVKKILKPVAAVAAGLIPGGGIFRDAVSSAWDAIKGGASEEVVRSTVGSLTEDEILRLTAMLTPAQRRTMEAAYARDRVGQIGGAMQGYLPLLMGGALLYLLARK